MPVRIAIVGPGRVGRVLARRFHRAGAAVLGFVGRDAGRVRGVVEELGVGHVLGWGDLERAHCVVFCVGDDQLADSVAAAAARGGRRCSLWLHTSGRHDLDVFSPAASLGVRVGSLHPLAPFPGSLDVGPPPGALAAVQAGSRSSSLLLRLCRMLDLEPVVCGVQDRALYHAACALAANGATALFGLVEDLLGAAGGTNEADRRRVVQALMAVAVGTASRYGAARALSGPVRRGDHTTVTAHLERLGEAMPGSLPAYRALMVHALRLAADEGLPADAQARLGALLTPPDSSGDGREARR